MEYHEDIAITPSNMLRCLLCKEFVENNDPAVESHLDSSQHRENYFKRYTFSNSIAVKSQEMLFCQLCKQDFKTVDLSYHIKNLTHCENLSRLKEMIKKDGQFMQIPNESSYIDCCICDQEIDFSHQSVKSHITESQQHRTGKAMALQPMNGIFSVQGHDEYLWCKVCQIFFDNFIELIFHHVEESEHAKTMRKILGLIKGQDITIERYLHSLKEDKAFCNKCNIEVPCNVDNLQRHINGKKHPK